MAAAGLGIIRHPIFISYEHIAVGKPVPILQDYKATPVTAYSIYPQTRHLS
jgi:hypothetical protein